MDRYRQVFLIFSIPFGLIVGSFLNVCIFRLPRNCMSIVKPRSRCTRCLMLIAWFDNLPVVSYLLLGGKCRNCRQPISMRYPLVEMLTGVLMAGTAYEYLVLMEHGPLDEFESMVAMVAQMYVIGALIVASFIDIDFRILPHEITMSGIIIAIAAVAAFPFLHGGSPVAALFPKSPHLGGALSAVFGAFIGGGTIYFVRVVGTLIFRKEAMGMGDVWYFAFLGGYLGFQNILIAFVLACFYGALIGGIRYAVTKDRYIPFGPFLSLGVLTMIFFSAEIMKFVAWYQSMFRGAGITAPPGP